MEATNREEFFSKVKQVDPKNYVLHHKDLEYFADKHYAKPQEVYSPSHTDFIRVPQQMKDWVLQEMPNKDRPKTLVVWGPSRTGKTNWARSLGNHSYLGYTWNVKKVNEASDYIVIDDVDMTNFSHWQPFLGK